MVTRVAEMFYTLIYIPSLAPPRGGGRENLYLIKLGNGLKKRQKPNNA
jgi:hypothetical protein